MARFFFPVFAAILFLTATPAFAGEEKGVIGTVMEVEGTATIVAAGSSAAVPAAIGSTIHQSDVIETAAESRVFILFIDDTQLILSENTKGTVNDYVYDSGDSTENKAEYSILRGAFQYVSGLLAKREDPDVTIKTPSGSIGIRGTELWGGEIDDGYGIQVDEGRVSVKNGGGELLVNKGEGASLRGWKIKPARAAWSPEKLRRIRDSVFLKRHEMVKQRVAQSAERQKVLRSRYREYLKSHHKNGEKGGLKKPRTPGEIRQMLPGSKNRPPPRLLPKRQGLLHNPSRYGPEDRSVCPATCQENRQDSKSQTISFTLRPDAACAGRLNPRSPFSGSA
ncbi:MAG: FecR domain-containing protein [Pseudomonadota bacterium]